MGTHKNRLVPTIYVLNRDMNNSRFFYLKIFIFLVIKFSVYLNRHAFVMDIIRAATLANVPTDMCAHRRFRSESWLGTIWTAKDANFLHADNKDSDQTARTRRLICV